MVVLLLLASNVQAQPAVQKKAPGLFITYHLAHPPTRLEAFNYGYGGAVGYRFAGRIDAGLYVQRTPANHSPLDEYYRAGRTAVGIRLAKTTDVSSGSQLAFRGAVSASLAIEDESHLHWNEEVFEYRGGAKVYSYGGHAEGAWLLQLQPAEGFRLSPGAGAYAARRRYTSEKSDFGSGVVINPPRSQTTYGLLLTFPASVNVVNDDWLSVEASVRVGPPEIFYPSKDIYSIVFSYTF